MCIPPNAPICNCFSFYVSFFTFLFFSSFILSSSHSLSYSQHKIVKSQEHKSHQVTRASHQNGITNVRRNTRTNSRTSQEIVDHPLLLRPPRTWPLGRCRCASRSCGFCHPPPPRHGGCAWCLLRPRVPAPCAPHSRGGHTRGLRRPPAGDMPTASRPGASWSRPRRGGHSARQLVLHPRDWPWRSERRWVRDKEIRMNERMRRDRKRY
jgi:hypothetical protein